MALRRQTNNAAVGIVRPILSQNSPPSLHLNTLSIAEHLAERKVSSQICIV
jgi:hypothetical protein